MAIQDLGPWLLQTPWFTGQLNEVTRGVICSELGDNFLRTDVTESVEHHWGQLLLAASVLATSADGACQASALRIAQACLQASDVSPHHRDSAALVLDVLANHPAISLAIRRRLLESDPRSRLPAPARLEWTRRELEQTVLLRDESAIRLNRFQKKLWSAISANSWVSASAPTSAGKSYVLTRWISELLREDSTRNVAFLVPTRALINEIETKLRAQLREDGLVQVEVTSLPLARVLSPTRGTVLVYTQERMHILLSEVTNARIDALVVDEAHKVGDKQRGVLLQQVIERIASANAGLRVVFASPMTSNPETLLSDAGSEISTLAVVSEDVTVNQNLIWASQLRGQPTQWRLSTWLNDRELPLGTLQLPAIPSPESKRLSFVAYAVSGLRPGNIIYVNGAADAEKVAAHLYDLSGTSADVSDKRIDDLIELCRKTVHPQFQLATVLRRGVAFHYGNLPLLIRTEIEKLFTEGVIRYLVCTSTLIEGVNMACRSIFLRGPQKGRGRLLTGNDFWNLAGRAGRWGREFQGNVVCVDASRTELWGESGPPTSRERFEIDRTTDMVLRNTDELLAYLRAGAPREMLRNRPELQYVFSYLVAIHSERGSILQAPWARRLSSAQISPLANEIARIHSQLQIAPDLVKRNPGISPLALDEMLTYFRQRDKPLEELLPVNPADDGATNVYTGIFVRLARTVAPRLGPTPARSAMLAITVVQWMRGFSLARLIQGRVSYHERKNLAFKLPNVIRQVMEEVEQIARFEAPRALNCYRDVLTVYLTEIGRTELISTIPDLSVFLELGVSHDTQIALIELGLSRTAAISLSELVTADDLTAESALGWISDNYQLWMSSSLPELAKREILQVLRDRDALPMAG